MSRLPGKGLVSTQEAAWLNWLTWMLDSGDRVGWFPASLQSDFDSCKFRPPIGESFQKLVESHFVDSNKSIVCTAVLICASCQ